MQFPIENCRRLFRFRCPMTWDELKATDDYDVRHCSVCQKNVYFCYTLEDVKYHKGRGDCIVVEVSDEGHSILDNPSHYLGEPAD
jgi:hypothetical protein